MILSLQDLSSPIIAAPMAGGVSTPELVAAVSEAGGLGMLAAGYLTAGRLEALVTRTRSLTSQPFGVNLFLPQVPLTHLDRLNEYAAALGPQFAAAGIETPELDDVDPADDFARKLEVLLDSPVALVSFTFGLPDTQVLMQLRQAGTTTMATVSSVAAANAADVLPVDAICLQGVAAGGHRATLTVDEEPNETSTLDLVRQAAAQCRKQIVAAGGITTAQHVEDSLAAGAAAAQCGTAFLLASEAGTSDVHRMALTQRSRDTAVTCAFSGRPARALVNGFMQEYGPIAPAAYPQVHHLTAGLRTAAVEAMEPELASLWAGTGYPDAVEEPAEVTVRRLTPRVGVSPSSPGIR